MLLLGPENAHVRQALTKHLTEAHLPFQSLDGGVLVLAADSTRLPAPTLACLRALPDAAQQNIKAVFFGDSPTCASSLLTAFVQAEPLARLLACQEHEWVRAALDDDWLFSVFHPIVHARSGDVFAHEALIRARRPRTGEIIGAGPLIAACEGLRLEHVLDQRARQTAIRNAAALDLPSASRFFINFLPNTIYDPEICLRTTMETAHKCRLDPARLVFEVVETEHVPSLQRLQHILNYYRERGVGTAVDDMGAGHTSLEYLEILRPDFVKIDRMVVVRAEREAGARRDMNSMIAEAKRLNIQVIAEGIETPGQHQMCVDAGADFVQGFLFARPANPPQSVDWPERETQRAA